MSSKRQRARRVTITKSAKGYRYRVQGGNWRVIDATEPGEFFAREATALGRAVKRWPNLEELVFPNGDTLRRGDVSFASVVVKYTK